MCLAPYSRIKSLVQQGKSLEEVYISLRTPFAQLASVSAAYKMLRDEFRVERVTDLASQGKSFDEVCDILDIPFNEISSVSKLYKDIKRSLNSSVGDSFIERWKKRKVGAPAGLTVHWLMFELAGEFTKVYHLDYNRRFHHYRFYRLRHRTIIDEFLIVRTSKKCYRVIYFNNDFKHFQYFSSKNFRELAVRMKAIYKLFKSVEERG